MKLYLISQTVNNDYDTYDSAVVAAESVKQARFTSPDDYREWSFQERCWVYNYDVKCQTDFLAWTNDPKCHVKVKTLGWAKHNAKPGVVCASFNAG